MNFAVKAVLFLITGFDHAQDIPADFLKLRALFYVDQK